MSIFFHLYDFVKDTEFCWARHCFSRNRNGPWVLDRRYSYCSWLGSPLAGESPKKPFPPQLFNWAEIGMAVDAGFRRNWWTYFVLDLRPHRHYHCTCRTGTESIAICRRRRAKGQVKKKKFFCRSIWMDHLNVDSLVYFSAWHFTPFPQFWSPRELGWQSLGLWERGWVQWSHLRSWFLFEDW